MAKVIRKSGYRPSPPATAGDAIDVAMKLVKTPDCEISKEAVLASMERSYEVVGVRCFEWCRWSPHCCWAVAKIKAIEGEDF